MYYSSIPSQYRFTIAHAFVFFTTYPGTRVVLCVYPVRLGPTGTRVCTAYGPTMKTTNIHVYVWTHNENYQIHVYIWNVAISMIMG